jgi:hypothetical protein
VVARQAMSAGMSLADQAAIGGLQGASSALTEQAAHLHDQSAHGRDFGATWSGALAATLDAGGRGAGDQVIGFGPPILAAHGLGARWETALAARAVEHADTLRAAGDALTRTALSARSPAALADIGDALGARSGAPTTHLPWSAWDAHWSARGIDPDQAARGCSRRHRRRRPDLPSRRPGSGVRPFRHGIRPFRHRVLPRANQVANPRPAQSPTREPTPAKLPPPAPALGSPHVRAIRPGNSRAVHRS